MSEKIEKLLEDILEEIKTLNQNISKLKEKVEMLAIWIQMLESIEGLRNSVRWDSKWSSFQEKDKLVDILAKSSETITKKILKLAPSIKN